MSFGFLDIWQHMGVPAMIVAAILLVMGLSSLTVFVERILTLRRSRAESRAFAAKVTPAMKQGNVDAIIADAEKHKAGHLARVVRAGVTTYWHARNTADISGLSPAERTRRHLERYMEEIGADLRRGMAVLASVGSVAPFVGLLGTVVGIISAFQGIRRPLVGVGRYQRGARRDGARARGRHPGRPGVQLPLECDRARRERAQQLRRRAVGHHRGLGGARGPGWAP